MKSIYRRRSNDRAIATRLYLLGFSIFSVALFSSCGSAEPDPAELSETQELGGLYTVDRATDGRGPIELGEPPTVSIDTEFGTLRVDAGCNDHFGSFTLADSGLASFTLAGQTNTTCDAATEMSERRLIAAFGDIGSWSVNGERVELIGDQSALTLVIQPTG